MRSCADVASTAPKLAHAAAAWVCCVKGYQLLALGTVEDTRNTSSPGGSAHGRSRGVGDGDDVRVLVGDGDVLADFEEDAVTLGEVEMHVYMDHTESRANSVSGELTLV